MTTRTPGDIHLTRRHPTTSSLIELWAVKPTSRIAIADIYCAEPGSEQEANAEFIVRAWNSFDDLLAALQGVLRVADRATDEFDAARAAIARATGAAP